MSCPLLFPFAGLMSRIAPENVFCTFCVLKEFAIFMGVLVISLILVVPSGIAISAGVHDRISNVISRPGDADVSAAGILQQLCDQGLVAATLECVDKFLSLIGRGEAVDDDSNVVHLPPGFSWVEVAVAVYSTGLVSCAYITKLADINSKHNAITPR